VILPLVVAPAAFETGDVAFHGADAGESGTAFAAGIEEAAFETDALERQIMTSRFVRDAEISAGSPPFSSMRRNLAATGPMLREKMGEFMAKCSLNLGRRHLDQFWVERDRLGPPTGETCGCSQPPIPLNGHLEIRTTCHPQQLAAESLEKNIAPASPILTGLRVDVFDLWQKAQVTKNRSSKVEHKERLFHQAAIS
jgi:hypothetical protein